MRALILTATLVSSLGIILWQIRPAPDREESVAAIAMASHSATANKAPVEPPAKQRASIPPPPAAAVNKPEAKTTGEPTPEEIRKAIQFELARNPEDAETLLDAGELTLKKLNDPAGAVILLQKGVSRQPERGASLTLLVEAYSRSGQFSEGKAFFQTLLSESSENRGGVLTAMADLETQRGNLVEAQKFAEEARELNPDSEATTGLLALIYQRQGDERQHELLDGNSHPANREMRLTSLMERGEHHQAAQEIAQITDEKAREKWLQVLRSVGYQPQNP